MLKSRSLRILRNIGPLLFCSLLCALVAAQAPAPANPILPHADPFITLHPIDGRYLLLATTGHNITLWSGNTIPTASTESKIVFTPTEPLEQLWSPTLWHIGNRWWIYFTAQPPNGQHAIYVLESNTNDPLGTYTFRGSLNLDNRPAIDPSLLTLHHTHYLMYVTVDRGENAIQIVRLADPLHPTGSPSLIAEPEFPWERGAGSTRTYPVNEGPTALTHDHKLFIVYSASDTASPLYCLGLLTFQGGDPLLRTNWKKSPQPVFSASPANSIYGPGRGTFAIAANNSYWLLYAAKSTNVPTAANRAVRAQSFTWNPDSSPNFGAPLKDGPIAISQ
jgi:GH43 family beta-xylosidase